MLEQKAIETAVKHIVARSTKQFFGYGPAERVTVVIQGDLVIFATRFRGPGILEALPRSPFGRLAMRHIAELFSREAAPELIRVARDQFGVALKAILSDLDYETGQSLGIALLDQRLPPPDRPADPELTRSVTRALAAAAEAVGLPPTTPPLVRVGPGALILRAPALAFPGVDETAEAIFAALARREAFRTQLRAGLIESLAGRGLPAAGPIFAVNSAAGLVAGALL